jgi:phenylacetate-CoA ligase
LLAKLCKSGRLFLDAQVQRRSPFFSKRVLLAMQSRRVGNIVRHAYQTVPFYRQAMEERRLRPEDIRSASELRQLPLIDKRVVQDNAAQFQSRLADPAAGLVLRSSKGASTNWTSKAIWRGLAIAERERAVWLPLAGRRLGCKQLHLLAPGSSTMSVRSFWDQQAATPRWISQKHYADPFLPYEEIVRILDDLKPDVVFSYGSYIEHFFRFLIDAGASPCLPRVWYYGADTLSRQWRGVVEHRFGVKVYSSYATTETGRIGFDCERWNGFHLNTDFVALRLVDESGSDVPAGQVGEVVVSNLHNTATVLLNYRLGDLGEMSGESCSCGRNLPVLRELHGRVSQSIQLADGRSVTSGVFIGNFRNQLSAVRKAQALSAGPGRICWRIVPGRSDDLAVLEREVLARCREVFGSALQATVEFVDDIPTAPGGKYEAVLHDTSRGPLP